MSGAVSHLLVSYDISDPKRLLQIARIMKDYGSRVLKSVFECTLDDGTLATMKHRIEEVLDPLEDSVRLYFLCGKCLRHVQTAGCTSKRFTDDEEVSLI